jgi:ISXO2-like transposase domain
VAVERPSGERAGRARAAPAAALEQGVVAGVMRAVASPEAHPMTNAWGGFAALADGKDAGGRVVADHDTVVHSKQECGRGIAHANSAEGFDDRVRRTVAGVFHHIGPKHAQSFFEEIGFREKRRGLLGTADRPTRKGRTVARKVWGRVPPVEQMRELVAGAGRRRLRPTQHWGIEILSGRPAMSPPAAATATIQVPSGARLDDDFIPF